MKERAYVVGIDPGKSGSSVFMSADQKVISICRHDQTESELIDQFENWDRVAEDEAGVTLCITEKVNSFKAGRKSAMTFGISVGQLDMLPAFFNWRREKVPPGTWMKSLKCLTGGDKNVSKRKAQEMFPHLKIFHYNADALLIAEYTRRVAIERKLA